MSAMVVCRHCALEIPAPAQICYHCGRGQAQVSRRARLASVAVGVVLFAGLIVLGLLPHEEAASRPDMPVSERLTVRQVRLAFGESQGEPVIVVLGEITNIGRVALQELQYQVDCRDQAGQIFDHHHESMPINHFAPGSTQTVKVAWPCTYPRERYHTAELQVTTCKVTGKFP